VVDLKVEALSCVIGIVSRDLVLSWSINLVHACNGVLWTQEKLGGKRTSLASSLERERT